MAWEFMQGEEFGLKDLRGDGCAVMEEETGATGLQAEEHQELLATTRSWKRQGGTSP